MASKRKLEGWLLLDNRVNEGVPDAVVMRAGLPPGAGRGVFESATISCSHCQAVVVLNPQRTRERAYCRACDKYLCDACGIERARTFECKPFEKLIDEVLAAAEKQTDAANSLVLLP